MGKGSASDAGVQAAEASARAADEAYKLGEEQLQWSKDVWNQQQPLVTQAEQAQIAFMKQDMISMKQMQQEAAEQWKLYQQYYEPLEKEYLGQVKNWASPENIDLVTGQVQSDVAAGVQQGVNTAAEQLRAYGVNPGSAKYASLYNTADVIGGAAQAAAGTTAAQNLRLQQLALEQGAVNTGRNVVGATSGLTSTGTQAGTAGAGAASGAATTAGQNLQVGSQAQTAPTAWYNTGANNMGVYTNAVNSYNQAQLNFETLGAEEVSSALTGIGKFIGSTGMLSSINKGGPVGYADGGDVGGREPTPFEKATQPQQGTPTPPTQGIPRYTESQSAPSSMPQGIPNMSKEQQAKFEQMTNEVNSMLKRYPAQGEAPTARNYGAERDRLKTFGYNEQEQDAIMNQFAKTQGFRSGRMQGQALLPSYKEGQIVPSTHPGVADEANRAKPPTPYGTIEPPNTTQFMRQMLTRQIQAGERPNPTTGEYYRWAGRNMEKGGLAQNTTNDWQRGNWENTWKMSVPKGSESNIPKGWETIEMPSHEKGNPTMIWARPKSELISQNEPAKGSNVGYQMGGMLQPQQPQQGIPIPPGGTPGGHVPPEASPSGGQAIDDVDAKLTAGEFVMPKDVTQWRGQQYWVKEIDKARKEQQQFKARNDIGGEPTQGIPRPPTFVSRPVQ